MSRFHPCPFPQENANLSSAEGKGKFLKIPLPFGICVAAPEVGIAIGLINCSIFVKNFCRQFRCS